MKHEFKKWLNLHKGKELTTDLIDLISQKHEDGIGDMLYNEGLCLESLDTGRNILYGDCVNDNKHWSVQYLWQTEKEFKTLKGAINFCVK